MTLVVRLLPAIALFFLTACEAPEGDSGAESASELSSAAEKYGEEFGGTGELYINGEKVAETEMPQMHIATYSLAETFDIGRDTGTQVSKLYKDPFIFNGELDRVVITLTD